MHRLPKNFTNELYGVKMLSEFKTATAESDIEDMYKYDYAFVSNLSIRTIKRTIPNSKCATDGVVEFNYGNKCFYGLQETKYDQPKTEWQFKKQLIQVLMYAWMFEQAKSPYKFDVYILNCESHFVYVYDDEITDLKELLWYVFPKIKECPSKAYSNLLVKQIVKLRNVPFKKDKITEKYPFHQVIRDIYKRCLK